MIYGMLSVLLIECIFFSPTRRSFSFSSSFFFTLHLLACNWFCFVFGLTAKQRVKGRREKERKRKRKRVETVLLRISDIIFIVVHCFLLPTHPRIVSSP